MKNLKFSIHPLFLVLGLIMLFCGTGLVFLFYLLTILLHELGHYIVAKRLGYKLENFCLLPQGALLYGEQQFFSYSDEIKVAIAGPLVNIILAICCVASWWILPISYSFTETFAFCNITTALFNLLPILPLDGGRCFVALFSKIKKRKCAIRACNVFGFVLSVICLICFIITCFFEINATFLVIAIFLIIGIMTPSKSNKYVNAFSKKVKESNIKKGIIVKSVVINQDASLRKLIPLLSGHNYNIVYVANSTMEIVGILYEHDIEQALEKHSLDECVKDLID